MRRRMERGMKEMDEGKDMKKDEKNVQNYLMFNLKCPKTNKFDGTSCVVFYIAYETDVNMNML